MVLLFHVSDPFTSTGVPNQLYCRIISLGVQYVELSSITDSCFCNFPCQIYTFPFKETMGMLLATISIPHVPTLRKSFLNNFMAYFLFSATEFYIAALHALPAF